MSHKQPEFAPATLEAWTKAAQKSAPGGDVNALNWLTPDGISVKPLYTAEDTVNLPHTNTLPGFEPFIRGPQATMYAVRPWTIRQYAGFSTAEESNAFYRQNLAAGGQGVPGVVALAHEALAVAVGEPQRAAVQGIDGAHGGSPRQPCDPAARQAKGKVQAQTASRH